MKRTSLVFSAAITAITAASVVGSGAYAQDTSKSNANASRRAEQQVAPTAGKPAAAQEAGNLTNKADQTKVVPDREDLKPGAAPTLRDMDANAQRQHDPDRATNASGTSEGGNSNGQTRDWSKIDKDNNGSVSPEEMEAWLKQAGPQAAPQK